MEAKIEVPEEIMAKMPHLQIVRKSITTLETLVELLKKRKELIKQKQEIELNSKPESVVRDYELNEMAITLIKTNNELAKTHSTIIQKEMYFKDYYKNATTYLKEVEENWDKIMERAGKKSQNDKELADLLKSADTKKFEENLEYKINHYIQVKTYIYPKKEPAPMSVER